MLKSGRALLLERVRCRALVAKRLSQHHKATDHWPTFHTTSKRPQPPSKPLSHQEEQDKTKTDPSSSSALDHQPPLSDQTPNPACSPSKKPQKREIIFSNPSAASKSNLSAHIDFLTSTADTSLTAIHPPFATPPSALPLPSLSTSTSPPTYLKPWHAPLNPSGPWRLNSTSSALCRTYDFTSFHAARGFVYDLLERAAKSRHHPEVRTCFRMVEVRWSTHRDRETGLSGISESDVRGARETDGLWWKFGGDVVSGRKEVVRLVFGSRGEEGDGAAEVDGWEKSRVESLRVLSEAEKRGEVV